MDKNVLVVAAHSDDEALGCAGTMAKHVAAGDKVHVIFMTNGVDSRNTSSNSDIENRQAAARKSADILGVTSMEYFDFPDNKMDTVPLLDIVKSIENAINELQPEIVYTHHIGDLNIDHQITHKAVMTACRPQPSFCVKEIYAFEVLSSTEWQTPGYLSFTPNVYIDISSQIEIKRKALGAYSEEMYQPPHSRSVDNSIRLNSLRGNSVGVDYAEGFILVRMIK
jgi:N-acetylglucosamine malate deacetylase 1